MKQKELGQAGFTLVEVLVAMLVTVVGVVAVTIMVLYGVRLQTLSRDGTMATSLAKAKVEELHMLPAAAPERQVGGSLTNNDADHFDQPVDYFTRRWVVAAGPAGTQDITVAVLSGDPRVVFPPVQIRVLLRP